MSQPESKLSRKIMKELRLQGCFCFKVWGSEHMMAGLPDIIGCYQGQFIGLEVKMPDKRNNTSPRQEYILDLIRQAGGTAEVICGVTEGLQVLSKVNNK